MKALFHGEWFGAQRPTKHASVLKPQGAWTYKCCGIMVPLGQRWLIRSWQLQCAVYGSNVGVESSISIWDNSEQVLVAVDCTQNNFSLAKAVGRADINPIIVDQKDWIYFNTPTAAPIGGVICTVWYEQLQAKDSMWRKQR